ncbi:MAG: energy-coupling factor transporter transmembrane component T [Rothia sp. (in: high G+C Gram-positive bacteria)]|nr:energy-coupling factor transporter transmembrane component T [Rothia sp. (in: high G+C Gram-positive bacteria)]
MSANPFSRTDLHESWLGRRNAGVKFAAAFICSLLVILIIDPVTASIILGLEILALLAAGFNPFTLLLRFWPILIASMVGGWATALLAEKTGDTVLNLGFNYLTTGSIEVGVAMVLRSLALALPSLAFFTTVDPTDWGDSLAQTWRLPARFVLAALAALRLVGILFAEWHTLSMTRRARGATGSSSATGLLQSLTALSGQTFALLVQAIRRGSRLAVTMEARGFGGKNRTWARADTIDRQDLLLALVALALPLTGYGISAALGTLRILGT